MSQPTTPAEVFHTLVDLVPRLVLGDRAVLDPLLALYAETTDVVHPFAPFGEEHLRSREELRRHFEAGPGSAAAFEAFEAVDRVVHTTGDPEVVIGEFRYTGSTAGRPFSVPCVFVLRVRDGRIVSSRDYADHIGFARAAGHLPEFATALAATA